MPTKKARNQSATKKKEQRPPTPEEIAERRIKSWSRQVSGNKRRYETPVLSLVSLGLKEFPESLRRLTNLEYLDLPDNKITKVPSWIQELKALRALGLSFNPIRELPQEIGLLPRLKFLFVSNTKLTDLPDTLLDLEFEGLDLFENPGLEIPVSILNASPKEILRYYFESRAGKGRPLMELKLLLVGRGKAGKTTLVKQLTGEPPNENESETHSIAIREFMLDCPEGGVRVRAWDFGGQEILHSTHQFFLTERSLYVLVLEPRTGLAQRDAEYWLKLIETQGSGSPVIVVLNWSRPQEWHIDKVKLRRKFPFIVKFISTDALHGDGIDELKDTMRAVVQDQMRDVWLPFPNRWRAIKDEVAGMSGNFLTYSEYQELCIKHGLTDPEAQADLAGILHALGLALYFGKDPRLHDTRVLNPSWVTGGVYAVIRAPSVKQNNGQLSANDMPQVLKSAEDQKVIHTSDYPTDTHTFILELMRAFQLAYTSEPEPGKPLRYLVPELLPEFEPSMNEAWDAALVRLRYKYEVLPPGLLPRFIVRTHALSDGGPQWRHGVVLSHAKSVALIREETDKPELQLFVTRGTDETRQILVGIIRRELELLHSEMRIQPVEDLELTGEGDQWISVKALHEIEEPKTPKKTLPIQPEGIAQVDVPHELNKLMPAEVRAIDRDPKIAPVPVKVFVSYAHDDERQLKRLDAMLEILERNYGLSSWIDKRLIAGEEWDAEIRRRLEEMNIFLFIASQSSLVRPYIQDPELRRARERRAASEIEVVTVKLEPCALDEDPFLKQFQRLAPRIKSIAESPLRSVAWEQVRKDLLPVITRVRSKLKRVDK